MISGPNLKLIWLSCLKNITLTFKEQKQNPATPTQLLWKPLTKNWQNICLSPWELQNHEKVWFEGSDQAKKCKWYNNNS